MDCREPSCPDECVDEGKKSPPKEPSCPDSCGSTGGGGGGGANAANCPEGLVLGIGNPLLDITVRVGKELLDKYNLKANDAIMAEEKHMPLYKEVMDKSYEPEFMAGGSAQNTIRVVQWIVKKPNICTFFGCVGNDNYGKILAETAIKSGVNCCYQIHKEAPTGTCAVLVTEQSRSLVANLAAAQKFTIDHLSSPEAKKCIAAAKYFYTTGFFIAVSPESVLQLAKEANVKDRVFMVNLSAPFVMQLFKEPLQEMLPYVDIIVGNESETEAFNEAFGLGGGSIEELAVKMCNLPAKSGKPPRTVVVTQGPNDVILVEAGKSKLIPVPKLPKEEIVDSNGAGDAFIGGFISQLIQKKPYKTCIECAIYSSTYILHHAGCTFTSESEFKN